MREVNYKEYSPEEEIIYKEAISKIMDGFKNGLNFNEACSIVDVQDSELRQFIFDDALKIIIAEMHYGKGMALHNIADELKVSLKSINTAVMEMLEDVGIASADAFKKSNPDSPFATA